MEQGAEECNNLSAVQSLKDCMAGTLVSAVRRLLHRRMRVGVGDGRVFVGRFHCLDKQGNLILLDAQEFVLLQTKTSLLENGTPVLAEDHTVVQQNKPGSAVSRPHQGYVPGETTSTGLAPENRLPCPSEELSSFPLVNPSSQDGAIWTKEGGSLQVSETEDKDSCRDKNLLGKSALKMQDCRKADTNLLNGVASAASSVVLPQNDGVIHNPGSCSVDMNPAHDSMQAVCGSDGFTSDLGSAVASQLPPVPDGIRKSGSEAFSRPLPADPKPFFEDSRMTEQRRLGLVLIPVHARVSCELECELDEELL